MGEQWSVINLFRMRWVYLTDSYENAVQIAGEYEKITGQPHGIERSY